MGIDNISEIIGEANISINPLDMDFWASASPEFYSKIMSLMTILKIVGIVILAYIVFMIIRWFFGIRRHRKVNFIYKRVNIIDKKLDLLLGKRKIEGLEKVEKPKKEVKEVKEIKGKTEKKEKKKSFFKGFFGE